MSFSFVLGVYIKEKQCVKHSQMFSELSRRHCKVQSYFKGVIDYYN